MGDYVPECDLKYDTEECNTFVRDMEEAGFEVENYHGRFYWQGPAVRTDDIQEVIRATTVKVQWDSMGRGYIVYPTRSGRLVE